jgi:hypothetical protein
MSRQGLLFGLLLWVAFSASASAQTHTQIPYYGEEFYTVLRTGGKNEELKSVLVRVLRSAHQSQPGQMDRIVPSCAGKGCYQHVAVGYNRARVFLLGQFYLVQRNSDYGVRDVYCEHEYWSQEFHGKKPGPSQIPDDRVVNVEHTWPQSKFTNKFPGDMQKSDLHHLFATDSQMNSARSSYPFGEVTHDKMELKCRTVRLGTTDQGGGLVFEPPEKHKGNVARALFYFAVKYGMNIDPIQEKFLKTWNRQDPVDEEELRRNEEIFKLQGSRNPFVDYPELGDLISDI